MKKNYVVNVRCIRIYMAWTILVCMCLLSGCGKNVLNPQENQTGDKVATLHFTDALGREVDVTSPVKTAVLSGSLAEVWVLAGGELAATTEDAEGLMELPEETVILGAVKNPSIELILEQEIDFVILSATIAGHVELEDVLSRAGITAAYFEIENFADYAKVMAILTDITGRKDLYQMNVEGVEKEIKKQIARADGSEPTILFLRAYSTGVKAKGSDSMTGQMLKELGCVNIADSEETLLTDISMEAIIAADPEYIFVTTMGESEEAALQMVEEILISHPAWEGLSAVKNGQYYVLPKELFHNKPNKRWAESYQILADYLYGE